MQIKRINEAVSVSPQIRVEDITEIKAAGFVAIVNNRPDGEEASQTCNDDIEKACADAGLKLVHIPMGRAGVDAEMVQRTQAALDDAEGPVLCYCRTGTRSTTLWALAEAGRRPASEIISCAAEAGYDISHLAGHLD